MVVSTWTSFRRAGGIAEDVLAENDQIRELAARKRALLALLEFCERRPGGVRRDRLFDRDLLLRHPAVRVLAVQRRPRRRGVEAEQRIQRRHRPVRAEREAHAFVDSVLNA